MDKFQKCVLMIAEQSVLEKKNKIYRMVGKSLTKIICVFIIVSFTIGGVVWCIRRVFESAETVSLSYSSQQSTNFNFLYQNNPKVIKQQDKTKVEETEGTIPGVRPRVPLPKEFSTESGGTFKLEKKPCQSRLPSSLSFDASDEKK